MHTFAVTCLSEFQCWTNTELVCVSDSQYRPVSNRTCGSPSASTSFTTPMHNQQCTSTVCYACYKSLCTTSLAKSSGIVALDPISDDELLRGERHEFEQDHVSSELSYFENTRSGAPAMRNSERRSCTTTSIRMRHQSVIEQRETVGVNRGRRQCHHPH